MNIQLVLVDFDDTIVDTAPRFSNARRQLFELLATHGFDAEHAERVHHHEVDPELRAKFGFGPHRLEFAFLETYHRLREQLGAELNQDVAAACAALGRSVRGTPPALEGALDALRRLAAAHPTVLYTQAGDAEYQLACVREAGILDILPERRVRIAASKGEADFLRALHDYDVEDASEVWMIGNSMRSDVNPALAAGANAILVESNDPWHYDMVEPLSDRYLTATSFVAAVNLLL